MNERSSPSASDNILRLIKTKGPQTAATMAKKLGVTPMAVRQHLYELRDQGMVSVEEVRKGVGRPAQYWHLTAISSSRFPDNHSELAVSMIEAVRAAFGEKGIEKLIEERTKAMQVAYSERIGKRRKNLFERVKALATIRNDEGYMAEAIKVEGGTVMLIENHCPICAAASSCTGICAGELELFQKVLGEKAKVHRSEHILAGARRCAYVIEAV